MVPGFTIVAAENPLEHVIQHPLVTRPADLGLLTPNHQITLLSDQILMMIVAGLLLVVFVPLLARKRRGTDAVGAQVPAGFANFLEATCEYLRKEVAEPALHEHTDRFVKYIWSVFFFILTVNLLGLLPIPPLSRLALGTHIGGTATGNVWVTGTLALMTMLMMIVNGIRLGGRRYLAHFSPGPLWLAPLLVPVEIIGLVARIFALAVRLFCNMIAGHILLAVLVGFIFSAARALGAGGGLAIAVPVVLGSVGITLLEIFVAFLQAFIFTFLTALFLGASVVLHHAGADDDAAAHREAPVH
ncbi:MAG TPA: F0F1 ATP synthase subunit A [Thermoanaerobaculia bacterium]|nr:F0F1 ATP synthase subunit A [Thermoanaerobaculia bacterium]